MAMENCPWALLFGIDYFFIFFLNKIQSGNETYHHIHCSPRLTAFYNGQQNDPNIFQALIPMLLGGPAQSLGQNLNFTPSIQVQIGQRYPEMKNGETKQTTSKSSVPAGRPRSKQTREKHGRSVVGSAVRNLHVRLSQSSRYIPTSKLTLSSEYYIVIAHFRCPREVHQPKQIHDSKYRSFAFLFYNRKF